MNTGIKVIHTVIESANGELKFTHTTIYDTKGRLSSVTVYNERGDKDKETRYTHYSHSPNYKGKMQGLREVATSDEQDKILSKSVFDLSGRLIIKTKEDRRFYYEYKDDKKGNPTMRMDFEICEDSESKNIVGRVIYSYDDNGNKIKEKIQELMDKSTEAYSKWLWLIKQNPDSDYNEDEPEYVTTASKAYKYDDRNRLSEESYGNISIVYNKEDKGYLKTRTEQYGEGEYIIFYERYNSNGDIIKSWKADCDEDEPENPNYIYNYDEVGNWIRRTKDKDVEVKRRIIVYYPNSCIQHSDGTITITPVGFMNPNLETTNKVS